MPEEQIVEQTAAPQPDEQTQPEAQEEELAEETKEEQEKKEEERKRKRTVTLLTALLLICLIAEVSLGLTLYQNIQNQRILTAQYEAYVAWQEEQRQNPPKVQYIGPTVRVVDGELVDNYAAENAARNQAQNEIPGI